MPRPASFDRQTALKQAMELFWARGYHATSLKDIEAALDMRPGSIYAAFGAKEALFKSALELYAASNRQTFNAVLANAPSPLAGLAAHVRNLGEQIAKPVPARACMLMKTILETPDDDPALRGAAEAMMRQVETGFADAFRAAQKAGQLAASHDPAMLAARLQAEILGMRAYAQRSDAAARIQAIADEIARDLEELADG